ncbi:MAG: 6-phosphogluconolactonase [Candidatus Binataceae bacterium]
MSEPQIQLLDDARSLYVCAAEEIAHIAGEAICTHGEFRLCLAGGSTPAATYELLATRFNHSIDWSEVQLFWGDERCVPPEDPASNFAMVRRTLLALLTLRSDQVHRISGELAPAEGAALYERELKGAFALGAGEFPRFDLILLGLGENRHTASLFPASPAIHDTQHLAVAVEVDAEQRSRITITPAVINSAQRVMFLVAGESKAAAVRDVISGPRDPDRCPAQIVAPTNGEVVWLLDRAAAKLLPER